MKKFIEKLKSLDKGTILRTILQILTYANQVVALIGRTTFASAMWYQILSLILSIAISAITYWYNNDWTNGAMLARDVFDMVKDGKVTEDEVKEFLDKHKKKGDNTK